MLKLIDRFSPDAIAFEELFRQKCKDGIAVAHARGAYCGGGL